MRRSIITELFVLIWVIGLCFGAEFEHFAPSIHYILQQEANGCVILSNGRLHLSVLPFQSQCVDISKVNSSDKLLNLLKGIPCLAVVDLHADLDPEVMEILAKPELHRIMIITKGPRVTLPEILKNKAQVFKVSEPYENQ
ncbi:hypothetical protein TCAL_15481, partial [Tigriopus californicus]